MGRRDDFFKTINHIKPEKALYYFTMCESKIEEFKKKTGQEDYFTYFDMPIRPVMPNNTKLENDYRKYFKNLGHVDYINEWGVGHVKGKTEESFHFTKMVSPMQNFTTPEEVLSFPLPDVLAEYRWDGLKEKVKKIKENDLIALSSGIYIDIFEPTWYLRGMENLLMDFYINEDIATTCLDRMTDIKCKVAEKFAETGVDVIIYGDDVGTQEAMMMSVETWRKWLKPRLKKSIEAAKNINPEVLCYYHSDGNIKDIIEDLIEIGVDILNPIQPECLDPKEIKKLYGDRISFWGTIGTQTTMPFGSTEDVEVAVKDMIENVGYNGGLIVAPTHLLEPDVPYENIEAFVKAVKEN